MAGVAKDPFETINAPKGSFRTRWTLPQLLYAITGPVVPNATAARFAAVSPTPRFSVDPAPFGRLSGVQTDTKVDAVESTPVTFSRTAVAVSGTFGPVSTVMLSPASIGPPPVRVSSTRLGVTGRNVAPNSGV